MSLIPVDVKNLHQLYVFLNNRQDHSDPSYSADALGAIRKMEQPCPNTTRADIRGIGACVGDNVHDFENMGGVTVQCNQARKTGRSINCEITGRKCDMCLPKPRKSGTAIYIIT